MTDAFQDKLQQSYELIRRNQLEEARAILQPILMSQPSADAWWLWANAVTNPEDARHALSKVLDLDPDYQPALQQLEKLNQLYPPLPEVETGAFEYGAAATAKFESVAPAPVIEPDFLAEPTAEQPADMLFDDTRADVLIHSFERDTEAGRQEVAALETAEWPAAPSVEKAAAAPKATAEKTPRRTVVLRRVLLTLLVIVVAVGGVLLVQNTRQQAQMPATEVPVAAQIALEPSSAVQAVLEAAQAAANAATAQLGGPVAVSFEARDNVPTLLLRVCRTVGRDIPAALDVAMGIASRYGVSAQEEIAAVGAMLIDCERDDTLLGAVTSIDNAAAYAGQTLEQPAFRATWSLLN